jgi:hypothetical protein
MSATTVVEDGDPAVGSVLAQAHREALMRRADDVPVRSRSASRSGLRSARRRVVLAHATGHAGSAIAGDPNDLALDAGVQIAAAPVLGEEGVQVGSAGSPPGAYPKEPVSARKLVGKTTTAQRTTKGEPGRVKDERRSGSQPAATNSRFLGTQFVGRCPVGSRSNSALATAPGLAPAAIMVKRVRPKALAARCARAVK